MEWIGLAILVVLAGITFYLRGKYGGP